MRTLEEMWERPAEFDPQGRPFEVHGEPLPKEVSERLWSRIGTWVDGTTNPPDMEDAYEELRKVLFR